MAHVAISPQELRLLLRYDKPSGRLYWNPRPRESFSSLRAYKTWNARYAGSEAFTHVGSQGYRTGTINNRSYRANRVIWALVSGEWPKGEVDHRNGQRADDRWKNLRDVSSAVNKRNCGRRSDNVSGVAGVSWHKGRGRWLALITDSDGRRRQIGRFKTIEDAVAARREAEPAYGYTSRSTEAGAS